MQQRFTGLQKAAILLITLGGESSAEIIKRLPEDDAEQLADAIARLDHITQEDANEVLSEFQSKLRGTTMREAGGVNFAREVLTKAFGPEVATRLLDRLSKSLEEDGFDFKSIARIDSKQLARFIQDEHPQTIAVIVSNLDATQAGALLRSLPAEIRVDVAVRVATLDQISPEIIRAISAVIKRRVSSLADVGRESLGGIRAAANMFNRLGGSLSTELIDGIGKVDSELADRIQRLMFTFNDLAIIDANDMKELLKDVDRKVLTLALKGADPALLQKFLACLSERGAEMMREDMEALSSAKPKDIDKAQQDVIVVARKLEQEGRITIKKSSDDQAGGE
jgi:flagellar motor switch protein FliG